LCLCGNGGTFSVLGLGAATAEIAASAIKHIATNEDRSGLPESPCNNLRSEGLLS